MVFRMDMESIWFSYGKPAPTSTQGTGISSKETGQNIQESEI